MLKDMFINSIFGTTTAESIAKDLERRTGR